MLINELQLFIEINWKLFYNIQKEVCRMGANRNLKNRTAISTAIENELYKRLKAYSEKTSIPISKLIDKAIAMYLETVDE